LNPAIQVFVIEGVFIVPDPGIWSRHLVADKPDSIVTRVGFNLIHCRAGTCPSLDGRLHAHGRTSRRKREASSTAYGKLTVGGIVILIAFARMRLTPSVFVRGHVLRFGKIGGARIEICV